LEKPSQETGPRIELIAGKASVTFGDTTDHVATGSAHSFNNSRPCFLQISGMLTPSVVDHEEKIFDLFSKQIFSNDVCTVNSDKISIATVSRPVVQKLIFRIVDENGVVCDLRDTVSITMKFNREKKTQPDAGGKKAAAAPTARRKTQFNVMDMYKDGAQTGSCANLNYEEGW